MWTWHSWNPIQWRHIHPIVFWRSQWYCTMIYQIRPSRLLLSRLPLYRYRHVRFGIQSCPHRLWKTRTRNSLVLGRRTAIYSRPSEARSLPVRLHNIKAAPLLHENFTASRSISRPLPHGWLEWRQPTLPTCRYGTPNSRRRRCRREAFVAYL